MAIKDRLSGNEAIANALRQVNPDVMAAFPITPSTEIPQYFSSFVANGQVDTEFVPVESEHSAMSACMGSEAAGARTVTATSSAAFNYKGVTIPANTETAVLSPTRYYCVPVANNPSNWTISFTCDGEAKSASFINDKAWEIGKEYIYIFSLKDITPKLVYVLSKDTYFDCNDILPGDVLSDADMTE